MCAGLRIRAESGLAKHGEKFLSGTSTMSLAIFNDYDHNLSIREQTPTLKKRAKTRSSNAS